MISGCREKYLEKIYWQFQTRESIPIIIGEFEGDAVWI